MNTSRLAFLMVSCFLCSSFSIYSQKLDVGAALSVSFSIHNKKSGIFSLSGAVGFSTVFFDGKDIQLMPGMQVAVNVYNNGLGTTLLKDKSDGVQVDLVNTFLLSLGFWPMEDGADFSRIRTFNNMTAYALDKDAYLLGCNIGSNVIVNNHQRNQQVGFFGAEAGKIGRAVFYNDGPFLHHIGLADAHDRWWTGGIYAELNLEGIALLAHETFNKDEELMGLGYLGKSVLYYNYDRFTGDFQQAFELSKYFSFVFVPAKNDEDYFYNQGQFIFGWKHLDGWGFGLQLLGNYPNDIQDLNHRNNDISHHISYARKDKIFDFYFDKSLMRFGEFYNQKP